MSDHDDLTMSDSLLEAMCEVAHDAYEAAAVGAGWETNPASRKPWSEVPEANKVTMRAAIGAVIAKVRADERKRVIHDASSVDAVARRAAEVIHADLHARLAALHSPLEVPGERSRWVLRADVLALFDGGGE